MNKYRAGDTFAARDITDDLIGAEIEWTRRGVYHRMKLGEVKKAFDDVNFLPQYTGAGWDIDSQGVLSNTAITILTPPPVKIVQPDEPTALGTLVRIEGEDDWRAVYCSKDNDRLFRIIGDTDFAWEHWESILEFAEGRQIVVSTAPEFPAPEPPEVITEWPEGDMATAIKAWRWSDRMGYYWEYRDGLWKFQYEDVGVWNIGYRSWNHPGKYLPITRVGRSTAE